MIGAAPPKDAQVAILLALHNGAATIGAQIESFCAQSHPHWSLIVSDDGSSDDGPDRVRRFAARVPTLDISVLAGPQNGFAQNFLHLLRAAGPAVPFVALSDQDDVWKPGRLARGLNALCDLPRTVPALYAARTEICGPDLAPAGMSRLFTRPPSFRNALVQSIGGGNTMMLNRAALDLVQAASSEAEQVVAHDWWIYQIVSGAGGTVLYDDVPSVLYRQHGANLIGQNRGVFAQFARVGMLLRGRFRRWNDVNLGALAASALRFTEENQRVFADYAGLRTTPFWKRAALLRRAGIYRQSRLGTVAIWCAATLSRF